MFSRTFTFLILLAVTANQCAAVLSHNHVEGSAATRPHVHLNNHAHSHGHDHANSHRHGHHSHGHAHGHSHFQLDQEKSFKPRIGALDPIGHQSDAIYLSGNDCVQLRAHTVESSPSSCIHQPPSSDVYNSLATAEIPCNLHAKTDMPLAHALILKKIRLLL